MKEQLWYLVDNDEDEALFLENGVQASNLTVKVKSLKCTDDLYKELKTALPDLLLLDVQLPGESGIECLMKLKADTKFFDLPVIIITNQHYQQHAAEAHSAGAKKYVIKPALLTEYNKMVKFFYNLTEGTNETNENNFVLDFSKDAA